MSEDLVLYPWWTRFLAALYVLVVLTSAVELHGEAIDMVGPAIGSEVSVDARHSEQKAHVEHSEIEVHPPCPACLWTQKSKSVLTECGSLRAQPPRVSRYASRDTGRPLESGRSLAPSRAPPPR